MSYALFLGASMTAAEAASALTDKPPFAYNPALLRS